ncbi:MAG: hypothetical protein WKF94_18090 [Solirubrobacteraceae bacterium]
MAVDPREVEGAVGTPQAALALALLTFLAVGGLWVGATYVVPALGLRPSSDLRFIEEYARSDDLRPEPAEQQSFLLAVAATLLLPLLIAFVASRPALLRRVPAHAAPVLQVALIALVVGAFAADPTALERFLPATRGFWLLLPAAALLVAFAFRARIAALSAVRGIAWELAAGTVAIIATALLCLAGFYTDGDLSGAVTETAYHIPFTFEELHAVAGGHTPLVDFTPQYTAVLSYVLAPLLVLRPFSIGVFTASMVALSVVSLMAGYVALRLLSGSPLRALLLYLPGLAIALVAVKEQGDAAYTMATYFAVVPMRYAGPLLCLGAVAVFARFGSGRRREWALLGALAAATQLNNFEFGLPTTVALAAAAFVCRPPARARWVRAGLRCAGWFAAGAGVILVAFVVLTVARSGSVPDFLQLAYFSRQFATAGYYMLPITTFFGLPQIIALTFVAALAGGVTPVLLGCRSDDLRAGVRSSVLTFVGVFGMGALAYWAGRSDDEVLVAAFPIWGLALAALAAEGARILRPPSGLRATGGLLAAMAVAVFATVGSAALLGADYGFAQPSRILRADGGGPVAEQRTAVGFTRRCVRRGSDVGMLVPFGLRVADEAGVRDWFPYNHPLSVVTLEQIAHVFDVFDDRGVNVVLLGVSPPEIRQELRRRRFRPAVTTPNVEQTGFAALDAGATLVLWARPGTDDLRCLAR